MFCGVQWWHKKPQTLLLTNTQILGRLKDQDNDKRPRLRVEDMSGGLNPKLWAVDKRILILGRLKDQDNKRPRLRVEDMKLKIRESVDFDIIAV